MQTSVEGYVDQPPYTQSKYQLCYLDSNNIGAEGYRYLSKTQCKNLHTLNLRISYFI